jgi:hypothetical protein
MLNLEVKPDYYFILALHIVYSESCEAKRKRELRQETKQKIDEKKLKNKLRVKRHITVRASFDRFNLADSTIS